MKNLLLAVDEPKEANQLIENAFKIINLTDAKIWIIHVIESDPETYLAREAGPQFQHEKRAEERKKEAAFLKKWAGDIVEKYSIEAEGILIEGPVIKSLKNIVEERNIDLVIAGHRKRNFLYELFTANKKKDLIDELKIPLLAVPLV